MRWRDFKYRMETGKMNWKKVGCAAFLIFSFSHFLFFQSSCTSIDCPFEHDVMTKYNLYKSNEKTDTLRDTLNVFSHRINRTDTLLLNSACGKTSFRLNVGYANPEDTLFFRFSNTDYLAIDTVYVKKENYPHFESVDCNASYFHDITAIRSTHHAIDTIIITNPSVTYDPNTEHFKLYIKDRR